MIGEAVPILAHKRNELPFWSGRMVARQYALLSSAVFIVSVSPLISGGQAVMMEHVALAPMLGALALVDAKADMERRVFAIGVLLGIATMVRTNLAYVLLSVLLLWPFASSHRSLREGVRSAVYVATGGMLVFGAIFAVYALSGHGKLLVDTAIRVAFAYSDSNMGRLEAGRQMLRNVLYLGGHGSDVEPLRFLAMFFWVAGLAGLVLLYLVHRELIEALRTARRNDLLLLFGLGQVVDGMAKLMQVSVKARHKLRQDGNRLRRGLKRSPNFIR